MSKCKGERKMLGVRLPVSIIAKLDELVTSTGGSRGDVVQELIARAEVRQVQAPVQVIMLRERGADD